MNIAPCWMRGAVFGQLLWTFVVTLYFVWTWTGCGKCKTQLNHLLLSRKKLGEYHCININVVSSTGSHGYIHSHLKCCVYTFCNKDNKNHWACVIRLHCIPFRPFIAHSNTQACLYWATFGVMTCHKQHNCCSLSFCSSLICLNISFHSRCVSLYCLYPWPSHSAFCGGLDLLPAGELWSPWKKRSCKVTNTNCSLLRKESTNHRKFWTLTQEDRSV